MNRIMPIVSNRFSKRAGGHSSPPLRGVRVVSLTFKTKQPHIAMRGGMWSGWAASRTGQLSDTASQHPFGGWQGGYRPRWQYPPPQSEMITPAIGDGRPTWPPNDTAKPSRTERSTGFRVTSGEIGACAMHPPCKRESNNADRKRFSKRAGGHSGPPLRRGFVRWYVTANLETEFS